MKLRRIAAALALVVGLLGIATPAHADPGDGTSPGGVNYTYLPVPYYGPNCYGSDGWQYVWNLADPGQYVFTMDSCRAATLVATKTLANNYSQFVNFAVARYPQASWPTGVLLLSWQVSNGYLAQCASHGTGITFGMNSYGMVVNCSPQ